MAKLGFRTVAEMVGRVDLLDMRDAIGQWKARGIDLSRILYQTPVAEGAPLRNVDSQNHGLEDALDPQLIEAAGATLETGEPVRIELNVRNVNRPVGAMLSGAVAPRFGHKGPPGKTLFID